MIITYIGLVISAILFVGCGFSYRSYSKRLEAKSSALDYLVTESDRETRESAERMQRELIEKQLQENRVFFLDFRVTHGSALGGCSALHSDGRHRKGSIPLSQIMMFGKNPAGQTFTYYIEEDLKICAMDEPDMLRICSGEQEFEFRDSSQSRDQGIATRDAVIKKDILYYIILDSKHEISIMATENR